ncbi:D-aminoacyl-tRNA deacylase [Alcanivorax sp.]|jgi:D-tyrosyl-tRNA(Tyr) deacylase|uniref:D-aminoacyl-tRNA deacylase n=1 Tax=Alcanivorax sp. TaxID=1872427 RepID=UPI0032D96EE5
MKVLMQRVSEAHVTVAGVTVGGIERGLLLLVGIERHDDEALIVRMAQRVVNYRVFPDAQGRMNLDIYQVAGEILMVSQFTLAADNSKGRRPGFSNAATPEQGLWGCQRFEEALRELSVPVQTGQFGADMQVHLINDGPVTFFLEL